MCNFTVETETELYNRLVPWGIATHLRSSSVKFSPSVCVAVVVSLTGEMAAQSYAYHAHETANSDKSYCYSWFVCPSIIYKPPYFLQKFVAEVYIYSNLSPLAVYTASA